MSNIKNALQALKTRQPIKLKTSIPGLTEPAYYFPPTLSDHDKIQSLMERLNCPGQGAEVALTVIVKVCDADGKQIFKTADREWMLKEIPVVYLTNLALEINSATNTEEAEKN